MFSQRRKGAEISWHADDTDEIDLRREEEREYPISNKECPMSKEGALRGIATRFHTETQRHGGTQRRDEEF